MTTYICPTGHTQQSGEAHTIIGCGATFEAEPDDEGLVDCPSCGIWFNPSKETPPVIATPAHEALRILAGGGLPPSDDEEYQQAIDDIRRI